MSVSPPKHGFAFISGGFQSKKCYLFAFYYFGGIWAVVPLLFNIQAKSGLQEYSAKGHAVDLVLS